MSYDADIKTFISARPTFSSDFLSLFIGEHLGRGASREVYQCKTDPELVIKIETGSQSFRNTLEWQLWTNSDYQLPHLREWLAPCFHISGWGTYLLQGKTIPCTENDIKKMPKKVPAVLANDIKLSNWGWYKGKIVCHDYGHARLMAGHQLEKVKWD